MCELRSAPETPITYTTNGSDPKIAGATYEGPFAVPTTAIVILAYAECDDVASQVERIAVPASWQRGNRPN